MVEQEKFSAVLIELAHTLVADVPIQRIVDRLVASIVDLLDVTEAGLTLISSDGSAHIVASSAGALEFEQLQMRLRHGPCRTAYDTGEPVAIPDLSADDTHAEFGQAALAAGMAAVFAFPLRHGEVRLGALDLYRGTTGPLDPQDLTAAQALADVTAAYLINAQARQDAHDELTGVPTRRLLERRMDEAARRGQHAQGTTAVLFADVDRFKAVNDTYGHSVGDALLVAIAQRLSRITRPGDILARVSGDEFVILCEDLTDPVDAQHLAARIQSSLAAPFELRSVTLRITASVGIAYAGPGELVSEQLVSDADSAMYEAKRQGGASHRTFNAWARSARQEAADGARDGLPRRPAAASGAR